MAKAKKKERCHFCGQTEGHSRQCSMPAIENFDGSPEKLAKDRELLKKKYLTNTTRGNEDE